MEIRERSEWAGDGYKPRRVLSSTMHDHVEVHHSAGARSDSDAETIRLIQGIYTYHVRNNGWSDIFYHYIVDDRGVIWEGRKVGKISSSDRAALTVMVLGNYETRDHLTPMQKAAILHINERWAFDKPIDWHKQRAERQGKYWSSCPGQNVISWLKTDPRKEVVPVSLTQSEAEIHAKWAYENILLRAPDEQGYAFWVTSLKDGTTTIQDMRWQFQAIQNAIQAKRVGGATDVQVEKFVKDLIDLARNA